jgi:hypothetical protein
VSLGRGEGAAGSTFYAIQLTNLSRQACRIQGFGGVSLVAKPAGDPIGAPADRTQRADAKPVVLQPGGHAEATLQVNDADNVSRATCKPVQAAGLRVYPPDETRSAFVRQPMTACSSREVHLLSLRPYQAA